MRSLVNKHAVITGGSRGIGLAIAHRFASEGASVTLVGRDEARLQAAIDSLPVKSSTGAQATPLQHGYVSFSVSERAGWDQLASKMQESRRNIDILVNAAGIAQTSLLHKLRADDAQDIVDTNLMGTIFGCQVIGSRMIKQKSGCIINISSLLALRQGLGASVYAASKAGIVGLTRSFALEIGRFGVRVNVLLPGYIQTAMTESMNEENLSASIPLGRLGLPDEVADAATFLVKNSYAHNTVLNLDGGLSAT